MKNTKTRSYHRYCSLIATSLAFMLGGNPLNANDISSNKELDSTIFEKYSNKYGVYFNNSITPQTISITSNTTFSNSMASSNNSYGIFLEEGNLTLQSSDQATKTILFGNETGLFGNSKAYGFYNSGATLNLQSVALVYGDSISLQNFNTGLHVNNSANPSVPIILYFGRNSLTNFGNIGNKTTKISEGLTFKTQTVFEATDATINFKQIQAEKSSGILIKFEKLSMNLSGSQIIFDSILSTNSSVTDTIKGSSGGIIIDGSKDTLTRSQIILSNSSEIQFKNITSNGDFAYGLYALGTAPTILGDNSSKIIFDSIKSEGNSNNEFGVDVRGSTGIIAHNTATYFFGDKEQDKGGGTIEFRNIKGVKFAQGMSDTGSAGTFNLNAYKTNFIFGNIEAEKASGIKSDDGSQINADQSSFIFKKIQSNSEDARGFYYTSIDAKDTSFNFGLISSNTGIAYGMKYTTLNLDDHSSIVFDSINSKNKATGIVDSSISGGSITFNSITGTEQALGIDLSSDIKVSNGAQIIFNNIGPSQVTSGIYYDRTGSKNFTSSSGWGNIVFKNIQPSSENTNTDKHIDVLKLSDPGASLKIKNVSIAHGNPTNFDNMLYGIYNDVNNSHFTFANTTATYEGVEGKDIAGNIIKGATNYWNNLNQTIKVAQNTTGYGIYSLGGTLGGRVQANITLDAKETKDIKANNVNMVGIYLKEGDLIQTKKEGASLNLVLSNATNAIGLLIARGNHIVNSDASVNTISLAGENVYGIVLEDGAKAHIENLGTTITSFAGTSKTVGVLFKGKSALSGTLAFANWQKGNFIEAEKDGSLNGSIKISAYSGTNGKLISTAKDGLFTLEAQGRIVLDESTPSDQNTYGLYSNLNNNPVYGLDNVTFNTRKDFTSSDSNQVYGIYSKQSSTFQLSEGSTLTFNVQKYKTDSGESFEGTAFGGESGQEAKLILSKNSSVIFNANGGKLAQAISDESSHVHLNLAGNNPERFQKTAGLELRSLEVSKFDLKDSIITLYASKDAIIASTGYTGGKAYTGNDFFNNTATRGGSDRLIIKGSDASRITNNTLDLQVDHIDSSGTPIYAVLAQVAENSKDKVIFNNLLNGESTDITV
ncbi:hypothetical protein, partial [Helicobacter kayseriensis]|uniref:hypothetical protein n=1 Tax=Helicobacter kayseriensis TaxID=2905877 RepID=UPI001E28920E